jgi:hypothetical protein
MAQKINTGNYQVCRDKTGIGNSTEILITGNRESIDEYWNSLQKDPSYNYYKNEEVFYRGTQRDQDGNEIDSSSGYVRM